MMRQAVIAIVALFVIVAIPASVRADKRVALVIGNSNYSLAHLANPKNDADDMSAALRRLQFSVRERKDLTIREFDGALEEFEDAAKDADIALFFFSGHGVQIDRRGFLAPVDVKAESESSALRELEPIQEVVSRIEHAAKSSVIILDACRDSPLQERVRRIALEKNRGLELAQGLPPGSTIIGSNTFIVYATVANETASDGNGRNSPFSAALLRHIDTPGLRLEQIFQRVTAEVVKATGGAQQPEAVSRLQNELILLPDNSAQGPLSEAAQTWIQIKETKDPKILESFRAHYGASNPVYDALAAERLEKLRDPQPSALVTLLHQPSPTDEGCDGLLVSVAQSSSRPCVKPGSGQKFKDCAECPEMVVVPSGNFIMGSPNSEEGHSENEAPQREVAILKSFAVGPFAVTRAQFETFIKTTGYITSGGCFSWSGNSWKLEKDRSWRSPGFDQDGSHPVTCVTWFDAKAYTSWLSKKTGKTYRLLRDDEREYVTRAGTSLAFWWGDAISADQANYDSTHIYRGGLKAPWRQQTVPVDTFLPNSWGLYNVHGNVFEWTENCWTVEAEGQTSVQACKQRTLRGGSWLSYPRNLRSAKREFRDPKLRGDCIGFRVARDL